MTTNTIASPLHLAAGDKKIQIKVNSWLSCMTDLENKTAMMVWTGSRQGGAAFNHPSCHHVFLRDARFVFSWSWAATVLYCCEHVSVWKNRAAMSFSALSLLTPPHKHICLCDAFICVPLVPLLLLVLTGHTNLLIKGTERRFFSHMWKLWAVLIV